MGTGNSAGEARRVAVVGAGSWGTALSIVAARNSHDVRLWAREQEVSETIRRTRKNPFYLSEFEIPASVRATSRLDEALNGAQYCIMVVPSHAMRETALRLRDEVGPDTIMISASKGIENGSLMRMSEVVTDAIGPRFAPRLVALSGPSFAREVALGVPTAIVAASPSAEWAQQVQLEFSSHGFRIYTNNDVAGVELGGAIKNVVAIAAGVVRGLGFGHNSVAAIITRGLAEMTRLALAQSGRVEPLAGLAGRGDLVLTCTGDLSRNRRVGIELGKGRSLADVLSEMIEVAEGVNTTKAVYDLGRRLNIDMPITAGIHALLYEDKPALEAAAELMDRPLKKE